MPREKDLKRLVRARMQKTGEAYTAARAQILRKPRRPATPPALPHLTKAVAAPAPVDLATLAGMRDEPLRVKTGRDWAEWVRILDSHDAHTMSHTEIAKLLRSTYGTSSWWTQSVTVGYERIKGLRSRGQQRNGTFGMTIARTFNVPVTALFDAWADPSTRQRWIGMAGTKVRTASRPKSIRLGWPDGSIVAVGFTAKGASKSSVALEHGRSATREAAGELKLAWAARLAALGKLLA